MTALIVYDSQFGNTAAVARAIHEAMASEAVLTPVSDVMPSAIRGVDLLVLGSPTQGGRPTKAVTKLLAEIPAGSLAGVSVAAFDTRVEGGNGAVRFLVRLIGFAAPKMDRALRSKGGRPISEPQGFVVLGTEGPLRDGELERAKAWARSLAPARTP